MKIYGGVDATVKHHRIGDPQGVEADLAGVVQQEKKRAAAKGLTPVRIKGQETPPPPPQGSTGGSPDDSGETTPDETANPAETPVDGLVAVPAELNSKQLRNWIGEDPARARAALDAEQLREQPRSSVIDHATIVIG